MCLLGKNILDQQILWQKIFILNNNNKENFDDNIWDDKKIVGLSSLQWQLKNCDET